MPMLFMFREVRILVALTLQVYGHNFMHSDRRHSHFQILSRHFIFRAVSCDKQMYRLCFESPGSYSHKLAG